MYKTNSKIVEDRVEYYICECYNDYYDCNKNIEEIAKDVYERFNEETSSDYYLRTYTDCERFEYWISGLPMCFDFYYRPNETHDLMVAMLNESEEEAKKYRNDEACKLLARLIYKTIKKF